MFAQHASMQQAGACTCNIETPLPFYETVHQLIYPQLLVADSTLFAGELVPCMPWCNLACQGTHEVYTASMEFFLTEEQRELLTGPHRKDEPPPQVLLRFSSANHPKLSGKDCIPLGLHAMLHSEFMPENETWPVNVEPEEYPHKESAPLDLTWPARERSLRNHPLDEPLELYLRWAADPAVRYCFTLQIVQPVSVDQVMESVVSMPWRPYDETQHMLAAHHLSDEIDMQVQRISLLCPLSKRCIETPVRSSSCDHLTCFDLLTYLKLNQQTPSWTCPVCQRHAPLGSLQVDSYFSEVLACPLLASDGSNIEFDHEGCWRAVSPKSAQRSDRLPATRSELADSEEEEQDADISVIDL